MLTNVFEPLKFYCIMLSPNHIIAALNWQDPIASPQIPVRLIISGVRNDGGHVFNFTHFYDYVNFQPLVTDPTVFEVPFF